MESSYITSAPTAQLLPPEGLPEVAFIGRSNCGKSSLINALLSRNKLARESRTPGRTRMANFFEVRSGDHAMWLCDLPGYGYAQLGRTEREPWQGLLEAYIDRRCVRRFYFLIDGRRAGDANNEDRALLTSLASRRPVTVVLTKSDKADQKELAAGRQTIERWYAKARLGQPTIVAVSSLKKKGIDGLREELLAELTPVEKA